MSGREMPPDIEPSVTRCPDCGGPVERAAGRVVCATVLSRCSIAPGKVLRDGDLLRYIDRKHPWPSDAEG